MVASMIQHSYYSCYSRHFYSSQIYEIYVDGGKWSASRYGRLNTK